MQHETDKLSGYVLTRSHCMYVKTMANNISVLQPLFLINELCDPFVHPNTLSASNPNAPNTVNCEYKLVTVSRLQSTWKAIFMDTVGFTKP